MVEKDFVAYRSNNNDENGEENWRESRKSIVERTSSSGEKGYETITDDTRIRSRITSRTGVKTVVPVFRDGVAARGGGGGGGGARGHPLGVFSPPIPRAEER